MRTGARSINSGSRRAEADAPRCRAACRGRPARRHGRAQGGFAHARCFCAGATTARIPRDPSPATSTTSRGPRWPLRGPAPAPRPRSRSTPDWGLHPALKDSLFPMWEKSQIVFIPFAGPTICRAVISRRRTASSSASPFRARTICIRFHGAPCVQCSPGNEADRIHRPTAAHFPRRRRDLRTSR